jgi:hypothetical protein
MAGRRWTARQLDGSTAGRLDRGAVLALVRSKLHNQSGNHLLAGYRPGEQVFEFGLVPEPQALGKPDLELHLAGRQVIDAGRRRGLDSLGDDSPRRCSIRLKRLLDGSAT